MTGQMALYFTIHILLALRGCRCCQGRLRSPTLALGGWMMSEISCKRVTQFDKSGDYISHTRRDCVQRSPSDDAKPELRRSPSESEMHRLRVTNGKRRRCRNDSGGEKMLPQRKRSLHPRSPHVSSGRSIRAEVLQSHKALGNELGPCPYG